MTFGQEAGQTQEALRALDAGPLDDAEMARMRRIGAYIYGSAKPKFAEQGDAAA
jgi:hypothetical protein